ncbi:hypothetical protein Scep_005465 [Stephania cephalantha]|uniref:Folylpolyglutamate synthase n=1 Tax=Stephania cephalantha TaxID=152367 RepID=A0AAP0Q044_9MAGN
MFTSFHQLSSSLRPFKIQSIDAALSSTLAAPNTSIASNPFLSFLRFRSIRRSNSLSLPSFSITMSAGGDDAGAPYQEALDALSALITKRQRADKSNNGDCFELMSDYVKILGLEDDISGMKIVHVAGEHLHRLYAILPHGIVREVSFANQQAVVPPKTPTLLENANEDVPMPSFFRFIALLAFKIFSAEQVDVAIMEVGLGGKFDATNVACVQAPVVCGIASLGFDHMEILGNTLGEIAGEKAGIFKHGVPAFTVPQPDEAMAVLEQKASELNVPLQVALPLDVSLLNGSRLGLEGEHQFLNAGLAVALCYTWLQKTGHLEGTYNEHISSLPDQFINGLATAHLLGRAQIVRDPYIDEDSYENLIFYLDGAHSPESMEVCGKWFSLTIDEVVQQNNSLEGQLLDSSRDPHGLVQKDPNETSKKNTKQILLFNCMPVRDPQLLLPRLISACAHHGVHFQMALFVPNQSVYNKIGSHTAPKSDPQVDVTWQLTLQRVWESIVHGGKGIRGGSDNAGDAIREESNGDTEHSFGTCKSSLVFPSLPLALNWLKDSVQQNRSVRFQMFGLRTETETFSLHVAVAGKNKILDANDATKSLSFALK